MRRASMMVCVLVLLAPAAARAQGQQGPLPPPDAAVVAGPLPGGATLVAFDRGGRLCVAVRGRHASCGPAPTAAWQPRLELGSPVYGVTTADAASVELLTPGASQTVPAGPGAYQGRFAGRVRFFLAATPRMPYRIRVLDAQGRALGAMDFGEAPVIGAPATVGHGRAGGRAWRAVAFQRTAVAATPLDRARIRPITCVRVDAGGERAGGGGCSGLEPDASGLSFTIVAQCGVPARSISGLAGGEVRRIDAVLGDGTRRRVGLGRLPARFGDPRRPFALVVGPGIAVRSLLLRAVGRTRSLPMGAAPAEAECDQRGAFNVGFGIYGFTEPPASSGAGPLVARDDGVALCVGLGTIVSADCRVPPIDPVFSRIERRRAGDSTAVLAVVPPEVTSLRLHLDRGAPVAVPTSDLPGYTGQYAGLVRAAALTLPGDRRVYSTEMLAADGHVLVSVPGPDRRPLAHAPRVLARLPGGVTVAGAGDCLQVGVGPPSRDPARCAFTGLSDTTVFAPCAARRTVVVSRLRRPATGLTAMTTAGTVRGRRHGAFAVAVLPPRAALREIGLTGAARVRMPLPPAARQCGYSAVVTALRTTVGRPAAAAPPPPAIPQ
ncbi:MAG TPA: hypothetical protein VH834_23305 [Solirubrobacteraceae bacterium]